MERENRLQELSTEIERLARMHLLYGLERSSSFRDQKEHVKALVANNRINVRTDLDPVSRNLYRRYFD